jgi:hypothetical protein
MGFKSTIVTRTSTITGKNNDMALPISEDELKAGLEKHRKGGLIQDCFPQLNAGQREFLLNGVTPEEWDEHINPVVCEVCGVRAEEGLTEDCPACEESLQKSQGDDDHDGGEGNTTDGTGRPEAPGPNPDGGPELPGPD